jgi:hypothetical protein
VFDRWENVEKNERGYYKNLYSRYFFGRAVYFTARFCDQPDKPISGSYHFGSCQKCPFLANNPRALFRINIVVAGNIRCKNITVRRNDFLTTPTVISLKISFYGTNLSAKKTCVLVSLFSPHFKIKKKNNNNNDNRC